MLSERQLEALLKVFEDRMQGVVAEYLKQMGEHLKDIGRLLPSDVNRLVELKRVGTNVDMIQRLIAAAANASMEDLERVFRATAESDVRFAEAYFEDGWDPKVKGAPKLSVPIERILKAQLRITAQEMENLSRTTIFSKTYQHAVDIAVQSVQAGMTDYRAAIRAAVREAGKEGLRVQYQSGLTRRLDTAVRQNVLDGARSLSQDVLDQLGKEYGADGVETSAHSLCAADHLPYQGKQFSTADFKRLQNSLDRPFGRWNCKHVMYPCILGVSVQAHDNATLDAYRENSMELIEIDGIQKSRYDWTQEQRRIETAVRREKDLANLARSSGDDALRREAQANINALTDRYDRISEAAGLHPRYERMRVEGFRAVKLKEALKSDVDSGIIQVAGQGVNTRVRAQKQQEHVWGSKEFVRRTEEAKKANKALPSAFYDDVDVEVLVKAYIGKGVADVDKQGVISEYFSAEKNVGLVYLRGAGGYETSKRVCIRYSKKGWHAFPVKEDKT